MSTSSDHVELWPEERLEPEPGIKLCIGVLADCEIERLVAYQGQQYAVHALDDAHAGPGTVTPELEHGIRHDKHAGDRRRAKRHGTFRTAAQQCELLLCLAQLRLVEAHGYNQKLSECIRRHLTPRAGP